MNNLRKFSRALLAIAMMLSVVLPTLAHDFEVDGIYYNITDATAKTVAVTYRGSYSFEYTNEYTGTVTIHSSVTYNGTTYSVTSIGFYAFEDCSGLTSVAIPNSVTSIGSSAFEDCSGLTSVTIPNSVTTIGSNPFSNTGWYKNQPDGILYLDNCCLGYKGNEPTGTLSIKEGTRLIAGSAFFACFGLTEVTIPNSVTSIGDGAFSDCRGLTSVIIPNSVTSIAGSAFFACFGLTSITIPNSVTSIGDYAFSYCSGLTEVTIGNSVTSIGYSAFSYCSGLTEVTIGNSVTSIGYSAFKGCRGLTSVTIPNSVTSIGSSAFVDCTGLTSITIPNSVTLIDNQAFSGCRGLTEVTIGNSVTSIGSSAFYGCSGLTSVTIPNSVTSIGNKAFYYSGLKVAKSLNTTPPTCAANAFVLREGSNALLFVPKGSMMSYALADGWSSFSQIQEFEVDDAIKPVLAIAYPEGGVLKQKVDNGTILELQIVPSKGWKCNSVTFNGVDVTNNLDVDGNYNTPSITADSQLNIVFVKDDGGVESTLANDIKVCVNGNTITILGTDEFADVEIYNTYGVNVYNGIEKTITLDSNGIYILTVEGCTFKFAM